MKTTAIATVAGLGLAGALLIQSTGSTIEAAGAWKTLFDGKSLDAWRGYKSQTMPAGWRIEAGALVKDDRVPDIITKDQYGDFELELEWKIGEAGNSGIFYRGIEDPDYKGAPNNDRIYTTGPEYQLLDDIKAADNKTRLTCAAAAYGLYPSPEGHLKPVGAVEQDAHRRQGRARRALVERRQGRRVRTLESGLGSEGAGRQVQGLAEVRPRQAGPHRAAGRSRRPARLPEHPHSRA